jgi:type VI protein secretion system component Hcp
LWSARTRQERRRQVSLSDAKIEVEYKAQKPDGSLVVAGQFRYDLKLSKAY